MGVPPPPGDGGADDELDTEPLISPLDEVCSDELLAPLERMEKYHNSEELFDRSGIYPGLLPSTQCVDTVEPLYIGHRWDPTGCPVWRGVPYSEIDLYTQLYVCG